MRNRNLVNILAVVTWILAHIAGAVFMWQFMTPAGVIEGLLFVAGSMSIAYVLKVLLFQSVKVLAGALEID